MSFDDFELDDEKNYEHYNVDGSLNGREGTFEWIVDELGDVTHRTFIGKR